MSIANKVSNGVKPNCIIETETITTVFKEYCSRVGFEFINSGNGVLKTKPLSVGWALLEIEYLGEFTEESIPYYHLTVKSVPGKQLTSGGFELHVNYAVEELAGLENDVAWCQTVVAKIKSGMTYNEFINSLYRQSSLITNSNGLLEITGYEFKYAIYSEVGKLNELVEGICSNLLECIEMETKGLVRKKFKELHVNKTDGFEALSAISWAGTCEMQAFEEGFNAYRKQSKEHRELLKAIGLYERYEELLNKLLK